jgi:hypothetical protein
MPALLLTLIALLIAAPPTGAQVLPPAIRAAAERISAEQLSRDLDFLASDALLGRNTPSPGFDSAAACIARRLEHARLASIGDDGTFFQRCELRDEPHDRYHLPSDEAHYLDPAKMEAVARSILVSVWALANEPDRPTIERPIPETVPRYR